MAAACNQRQSERWFSFSFSHSIPWWQVALARDTIRVVFATFFSPLYTLVAGFSNPRKSKRWFSLFLRVYTLVAGCSIHGNPNNGIFPLFSLYTLMAGGSNQQKSERWFSLFLLPVTSEI